MSQQPKSTIIQSRQNPKVKHVVKLRQRSHRDRSGQFVIEGHLEVDRAVASGLVVEEILFCRELFTDNDYQTLLQKAEDAGITLQEVAFTVFEKIAYRENPDGILAIAEKWAIPLEDIELSKNPLLLVAEGIEKPGNLGNLIRTAEAVGVDALIVTESVVDIFNPNVIRASRGLIFTTNVVSTSNEVLKQYLKKHKIQAIATTPHTDQYYWDLDMKGPVALMIGSEKDGLSDYWMDSTQKAKVPLIGEADSLNASITGALVLYEALRQRQ